jgi:two-component system nitrate/nitrite response regulator NarL
MRILIADDHAIVRPGVRQIPNRHESKPDLLLLDISMPVRNGLDAAREILQKQPGLPIIILSMHGPGHQSALARDMGVRGYVEKSKAAMELRKAI